MLFKHKEFNHDEELFHRALNITDRTKNIVREKIFFSSFSNALQAMELFEDIEDAPRSLCTVTGDLKRCLDMMNSEEEYEYALLSFTMYQRLTKPALSEYKMQNRNTSEDKEEILKHKIIEAIMELHRSKEEEEQSDDEEFLDEQKGVYAVNHSTMKKRLKYVLKSKYNFNVYMDLLEGKDNSKSDFDIEGLLGDILKGDD